MHDDGVIAYPTESVYGLGCLPTSIPAIQNILRIKQRPWQKGLLLVVHSVEQAMPFIAKEARHLIQHFNTERDYPVTWLFPAAESVSPWLKGAHNTIAIRLSKHPIVMALCQQLDSALVSTSANRAGQMELRHAHQVRQQFRYEIDGVIAGAVGSFARPSAIINATDQTILRAYDDTTD